MSARSTNSKPFDLPQIPAGYRLLARVRFPWPALWALGAIALFPLFWLFNRVSQFLTGQPPGPPFPLTLTGGLLALLVAGPLTMTLHELTHGLAFRALGYRPRYGLRSLYLYVTVLNEPLPRDHVLAIVLAPVLLLTLLGLPLLSLPALRGYVLLFLVVNVAGSVGDLWLAWRLSRLPRHVLFVDRQEAPEIYG